MSLENIKKLLAESELSQNVILLFGDEVFLKNHYKSKLIERIADTNYPDMNNFYFDEKNYKISEVNDAIETLPFMADKKMLYFKNSYIFKTDSRSGAKQEYRDYWESVLKAFPMRFILSLTKPRLIKEALFIKKFSKTAVLLSLNF